MGDGGQTYQVDGRGQCWANCVKIGGGAIVGEMYEDHGRWRWWANCVRIVGGGDDGPNVSGSWTVAIVGELYEDDGRGRW